jgi:hypothetical protein
LRGLRAALRTPERNLSVTDIFHEVEEEVRRERYEILWKKYGDYVIAGVAAIAIAIAGYKFWQRYETQQLLSASSAFNAAQKLAETGNNTAAAQQFASLAKTAPKGYADLSRLAEAGALLAANNRSDALTLYKSIADSNSPLANVARLRAGWAMADTASKAELQTLLAPASTSAWRYAAGEVLAYADYHAGNLKQAQAEYESLAKEADAPRTLRARADAMATFIRAGGDKEFGTVPKPAPQVLGNPKGPTSP